MVTPCSFLLVLLDSALSLAQLLSPSTTNQIVTSWGFPVLRPLWVNATVCLAATLFSRTATFDSISSRLGAPQHDISKKRRG